MGRPKGSKNKAIIDNDVTILTPGDFDAGVPNSDEPGVAEDTAQPVQESNPSTRNTDEDAPTQGQLAKAIQALADSAPVRRVPFSKFKTRSPFNPTGNKKRKLLRRCYQNGFPMDVKKLHDEEISLLNQITPGVYLNGLVTIIIAQNGSNSDLHMRYKNKSIDDRMALKSEFRNLTDCLRRCVDEGKARGVTTVSV